MSKSMSPKQPERITPYNPLNKTNLGMSITEAVLKQPVVQLPPDAPFIGAGIYAIYYEGDFPLYKDIAKLNIDNHYQWPIYVGKAVPAGARKGGYGLGADPGTVLYIRLAQHASSIDQAENLRLADFRCRFLVVDDIWIPLAESLLIEMFSPLWNRKIDGFGNHDPGKGRHQGQRPPWDVLHPGRPWALRLQPPSTDPDTVREDAEEYLSSTKIKILAQQENREA